MCRAASKEKAVAQLLPEMRDCVEYVSQRWAMRDCYPNPKGIKIGTRSSKGLSREDSEMNGNGQRRLVAGWCPDCEGVCFGKPEGQCKCPDCGSPLTHIAICTDGDEMWRYLDAMYGEHEGPTLEEEARAMRSASDAIERGEARHGDEGMVPDWLREMLRECGCEDFPLCDGMDDSPESDELPGEGEVRMFMVTPTPFPVWVRGEDWEDAAHVLRGDIDAFAVAGFAAALKEGSVLLSAVPVSDDEDAPGMVMFGKVVHD